MEAPEHLTRKQRIAVAVLSAIVALTRFVALSKGPWDWDEVLFCLALNRYDVAEHRPHPPGFPLHILLGRVAKLITHSDFSALQAVNILAGVAVFPVLFWLAWTLRFRFDGSIWAATLFAFLPNVWFYGGTAFSDVPAMVLFLAAAAGYLSSGTSERRYAIASLLAAAAILYRPHEAMLLIFPWALASWRLGRIRRWRAIVAGSLVAILIVAIGYGSAIATTGFGRYMNAMRVHAADVAATDSLRSPGRPPLSVTLGMLADPYQAGKVSWLINVLALAGIVLGRREAVAPILLMFVPVFLFTLVATNPLGASRMSLGYMAGVILLATEGALVPGRFVPRLRLPVSALLLLLIIGRLVTWVLPAFDTPRRTNPPQVEAMLWLREHASPRASIVFEKGIDPWVRYYLADRKTVRFVDAMNAPVGDFSDAWFVNVDTSNVEDAVLFRRPRNRTWNIVTQRGFEAFVQPMVETPRFGGGWYQDEEGGSEHWRWAARRSSMVLTPMRGRREITLDFIVPVDSLGPIELTFSFNGRPVQILRVTKEANIVHLVVDPSVSSANVLDVEASRAFVPAQRGGSDDQRELAWMLRAYRIRQAGLPAREPAPIEAEKPRLRKAG